MSYLCNIIVAVIKKYNPCTMGDASGGGWSIGGSTDGASFKIGCLVSETPKAGINSLKSGKETQTEMDKNSIQE